MEPAENRGIPISRPKRLEAPNALIDAGISTIQTWIRSGSASPTRTPTKPDTDSATPRWKAEELRGNEVDSVLNQHSRVEHKCWLTKSGPGFRALNGRGAASSGLAAAAHVIDTSTSSTAREIATARRADSVAFLHRAPFALGAYELGFLPGFREDWLSAVPVHAARHPGRDARQRFPEPRSGAVRRSVLRARTTGRCHRRRLRTRRHQRLHVAAARQIQASYPEAELIIVPKSRTVIDAIPEDLVLGFHEAMLTAWRTNSPTRPTGAVAHPSSAGSQTTRAIRQLTDRPLSADPPAGIVGVDWNGLHRGAQFGEFWTTDGWDDSGRDADHVNHRLRTVRHNLAESVSSGKSTGSGRDDTPGRGIHIEYGGRLTDLEQAACTECGTNVWRTPRGRTSLNTGPAPVGALSLPGGYFTHRHRNNHERSLASRASTSPPA